MSTDILKIATPATDVRQRLPAPQPVGEPPLNLAEVPAWARAKAERRLELVQRAQALLAGSRGGRTAALRGLAVEAGVSSGTLYEWLASFGREGFAGLIPAAPVKKGSFTALSPALQEFVTEQFLDPRRPSPTTVYRRVVEACAHLREPAPSPATVNRYLRTLPLPAVVLARQGPKAWRAQCEPKCERDFSTLDVGAWWVSDHREFDVFVAVQWWDATARELKSRIARPWLTAWLDLRSRTLVGWQVCLSPSSETIACALRDGILRYGLPTHLYRDNGKDYTCHYWGGRARTHRGVTLSEEACALLRPGVLSEAGVSLHAALPYTPWSKPIESWFGHTFPEWERTLPGWCGRDNKERPEKLADEIARGELLTLEAFIERVAERICAYNATPHSALDGATPDRLWQGVTIERPQPRTLDLLLMRHKPVTVTAQGIRLFGRCYWHDELALRIRQRVDVKYDPREIGRLICFDAVTGAYLCEAVNHPALTMGASAEDMKALAQRKKAAKAAALAYSAQRRVLQDPERVLGELAAARQVSKVVALRPDPLPPGTRPVPKLVPALDRVPQAGTVATRGRADGRPSPAPAADGGGAGKGRVIASESPRSGRPSAPPPADDPLADLLGASPTDGAGTAHARRERERDEAIRALLYG
jgi:putative transposase